MSITTDSRASYAIINPQRRGELDAVEMFAGYGGMTEGVEQAGVPTRLAVNHWDRAIESHAKNFPHVDHQHADLLDDTADRYADPAKLPAAKVLIAAPSCRHHSRANAERIYRDGPNLFNYQLPETSADRYASSERSRATAVCPLRYAAAHRPLVAVIECTIELAQWGPKAPNRSTGNGSTFQWWLGEWRRLGYDFEILFLNSGFFPPCPQSRDRMYCVFWQRGLPRPDLRHRPDSYCTSSRCGGQWVPATQAWKPSKPSWPLQRWGRYSQQYFYACTACGKQAQPLAMPAFTAIDFSDLGPTVGERTGGDALKPKTLERIRRGINKFRDFPPLMIKDGAVQGIITPNAGNTYEHPGCSRSRHLTHQLFAQSASLEHALVTQSFISEMRGGGSFKSGQHDILSPTHTVTAGGLHHGLCSFAKFNGGPADTAWHPLTDPLGTITARDTTGVISLTMPLVHANSGDRYRSVLEQLAALTTARERYLVTEHRDLDGGGPLDLDAIHFRMLRPRTELRRAMAFPERYEFVEGHTQADITRGLGNAVTPPVSQWIMGRLLPPLTSEASA